MPLGGMPKKNEIGDCVGGGIKMNEKEKAFVGYILNKMHLCPFEDESGVDFNKWSDLVKMEMERENI